MSQFEPALKYLLQREGDLQESPNDPGGITKCGISLRFLKSLDSASLRKYGLPTAENISRVDVEQLTPGQIKALYQGEFWDHAPFDRINNQNICNYLFDACVNLGIAPAVKCLQHAIWALERDRTALLDDGILGPKTLDFTNNHNQFALLSAMRSERAGEYRLIAKDRPEQNVYLNGWLNRSYNGKT
jgi:lysozyme family protein